MRRPMNTKEAGAHALMRSGLGSCATILVLALATAAQAQTAMPPGHPPVGQVPAGAVHGSRAAADELVGSVTETMDASSYTYVKVDTGTRSVWAAAPRFVVAVGDRVALPTHSPMQNYRSDSLGRTFPLVYFAEAIRVVSASSPISPVAALPALDQATGDMTAPHPTPSRASIAPAEAFAGIEKPESGYTVAEVFEQAKALAGKEVALRGRVAKYSPRIMGTNWLHLQDGTSTADGRNDLVVTTGDAAKTGDVVLVRGVLTTDRDFGHGYRYELIVEGASVAVESD